MYSLLLGNTPTPRLYEPHLTDKLPCFPGASILAQLGANATGVQGSS